MKTINPTSTFQSYMKLQIRYLSFVCSVKRIEMLDAIEHFSYRFKMLYFQKYGIK
jgi:hypothetical protein